MCRCRCSVTGLKNPESDRSQQRRPSHKDNSTVCWEIGEYLVYSERSDEEKGEKREEEEGGAASGGTKNRRI